MSQRKRNRATSALVSCIELTKGVHQKMPVNAAMFLFLAAGAVALFAFCSIVVWVSTPSRERQVRDRLALLKTLAEQPGENARQVLEFLRAEDEKRIERKER